MGEDDGDALARELQASLRRLEASDANQTALLTAALADIRSVKQVTGLLPVTNSTPPATAYAARTYHLRTVVTVAASVAAGAVFDKLIALVASIVDAALVHH